MTLKRSVIICIDEIEIYLHDGLQKKLKSFVDKKSEIMQIFYTTHSKVFVDTYKMKNTILLTCKYDEQFVIRKNKNIDVVETIKIDVDSDDGFESICEHLDIEIVKSELLQEENLLVEGQSDKKYIEELANYFNINVPNIISANGADNIQKYLEFYDAIYRDSKTYKPAIRVVLDNENKGREVAKKIRGKVYNYTDVDVFILPNFSNTSNRSLEYNSTNNEIEDFIYPEVLCFLINILLDKKNMNMFDNQKVSIMCSQKAFSAGGILAICEHEKNAVNPEDGDSFTLVSSSDGTNKVKEGLAKLMNLEGNKRLIKIMDECSVKYPEVRESLIKMLDFSMLTT